MSVEATEAQAIDMTREAHVAAVNSGDVDAWAAAFANDGVQMPPNAPANVGRDNIQAWSGEFLGAFRAELSLAPDEVQIAGADWAFERGTYRSPSLPRPAASSFRTLVTTSRSTNGSPTITGQWPATSGTAAIRHPACPHRRIGASARRFSAGMLVCSR